MLQSRLIAKRPSFSSVDEHIAQIILSMPYDANMTSTSLAARCEVSQSTIVRFAQKLGYPSFREFLSDYVAFKLTQPAKSTQLNSPLKMSLAQENIDYIDAHASTPSFQSTLKKLCEAKQIVVVCDDTSRLVGEMMSGTLQEYLLNVKLVYHGSLMSLHQCEEGDIVVFLEGLHSDQLLEAVLLSKHAQFETILITQKVNSSLRDYVHAELHTLPTQRDKALSNLEFMHGCLHILVHCIAYLEANNPTLMEARATFKQRVNAIKALAKHKALD
jgi:DNA-binding MurR/RpiR family transcriptional regulator